MQTGCPLTCTAVLMQRVGSRQTRRRLPSPTRPSSPPAPPSLLPRPPLLPRLTPNPPPALPHRAFSRGCLGVGPLASLSTWLHTPAALGLVCLQAAQHLLGLAAKSAAADDAAADQALAFFLIVAVTMGTPVMATLAPRRIHLLQLHRARPVSDSVLRCGVAGALLVKHTTGGQGQRGRHAKPLQQFLHAAPHSPTCPRVSEMTNPTNVAGALTGPPCQWLARVRMDGPLTSWPMA
jgi:hypothetical protein